MDPLPNPLQGGASNSLMHDKKMYSPATIRRALDLVKTSEPGKSKHDPRKQGSLREAAAVAGVASAETVRQWLKKDMSQEAIKKRLSKRGRKRKLDDLLLQKLRGYLEKHHREQTPYTQSDVIAFVAKETDGQILLTNVDVTRYTQRLGFAKQQRRPGESDEEDNLGFLQSAGMESPGALGQGSGAGMYTGQSMYGAPQLINTGFNAESLKYPASPGLFGAYLGGGSSQQGQMSQQQPGGQQGGLPKSIYQPVAPPPPPPPVQALQYFAKKYASANGLPPLPLMPNIYNQQQQQQQQQPQQQQQQQAGSMQQSGQQPSYQMYSNGIPLSQQAALNRFLAQQYPSFNMPATSAGQGGVPQLQELNFPPLHSGGSMGLPSISPSGSAATSAGGNGGSSLNGAASSLSSLSSDANDAMNLFGLRGFPTSLSSDLQGYQQNQQQQQQHQPQQQQQQQPQQSQQQQQPMYHLSQQEAAGSYRPEGMTSSQTEPEE